MTKTWIILWINVWILETSADWAKTGVTTINAVRRAERNGITFFKSNTSSLGTKNAAGIGSNKRANLISEIYIIIYGEIKEEN